MFGPRKAKAAPLSSDGGDSIHEAVPPHLASKSPLINWKSSMVLDLCKLASLSVSRLLFALIALSLTLSVPQVSQSQEAGAIRGRVLDRDGGEPLVSVRVQIRGTDRVAATDVLGAFLLPGVPAGSYTVVAGHIGYAAQRAEVGVQPGSTTEIELMMERSASLPRPVARMWISWATESPTLRGISLMWDSTSRIPAASGSILWDTTKARGS